MWKKDYCKENLIVFLCVLIIVVVRFISIRYVPDVFCDEKNIINHLDALLTNNVDKKGSGYPFYYRVGAGTTTYAYIYPMFFLCRILGGGVSALKMRIIQQCLTIIACFLLADGVRIWTKNKNLFLVTLLVSLTSPWSFVQSNRIWDPALVPIYFGIHFFFFARMMCDNMSKKKMYIYSSISFGMLVLLAVVYPPCRIPAVAMWIYEIVWVYKYKKNITVRCIFLIILICTIIALPLAVNLLKPEFNERAASLFVFNRDEPIYWELHEWFVNFASLCSPDFLFISGDQNYRHSLPVFGMLGTISAIPLLVQFKQKMTPLVKYMLFIIGFTYSSVALTNEGMPHSLRSCLAYLPFAVIISLGWEHILEKKACYRNVFYILMSSTFALYCYIYSVI